jgi:hypothetical protein
MRSVCHAHGRQAAATQPMREAFSDVFVRARSTIRIRIAALVFREFTAPAVDGRAERTLARSHVAPECDGRHGRTHRRNHLNVSPYYETRRPVAACPASAESLYGAGLIP